MKADIRGFRHDDIPAMIRVWNEVVAEGIAFPQEDLLTPESGAAFFQAQTHCGIAETTEGLCGLYILHPNNVGRCSHICNASYAVSAAQRGHGIGEKLVRDSLTAGKRCGFKILQFNAVVATNTRARELYERLGFLQLGTIPGGFRLKDGCFEGICPYYRVL